MTNSIQEEDFTIFKTDIYKRFDNELTKIFEIDKKKEYKKRLQKEINRIKNNRFTDIEYCQEHNIDYETFITENIERQTKNNNNERDNGINAIKQIMKRHLDNIFNKIKYYSFDEIFEYSKQKRDQYLNENYAIYIVKIHEYILDYILINKLQNNNVKNLETNSLSQQTEEQKIIKGILNGCEKLIENPSTYKVYKKHYPKGEQRENIRTTKIIDLSGLKEHYHSETQYETGYSETKKSVGKVDLAILNNGNNKLLTIGEAINWSGYNKGLKRHIIKLQDNYNLTQLPFLLHLIYFEDDKSKFHEKFNYFLSKIKKEKEIIYPCKSIKNITSEFTKNATVKIVESKHNYSNKDIFSIFHFFIDFSDKSSN